MFVEFKVNNHKGKYKKDGLLIEKYGKNKTTFILKKKVKYRELPQNKRIKYNSPYIAQLYHKLDYDQRTILLREMEKKGLSKWKIWQYFLKVVYKYLEDNKDVIIEQLSNDDLFLK